MNKISRTPESKVRSATPEKPGLRKKTGILDRTRFWVTLAIAMSAGGYLLERKSCGEPVSEGTSLAATSRETDRFPKRYQPGHAKWSVLPVRGQSEDFINAKRLKEKIDKCLSQFKSARENGVISKGFHEEILDEFNRLDAEAFIRKFCEIPINYIREYTDISRDIFMATSEVYEPYYQQPARNLGELHDNVGRAYMDRERLRLKSQAESSMYYLAAHGVIARSFSDELAKAGWELDSGELLRMDYAMFGMITLNNELMSSSKDASIGLHNPNTIKKVIGSKPATSMKEFWTIYEQFVTYANQLIVRRQQKKATR